MVGGCGAFHHNDAFLTLLFLLGCRSGYTSLKFSLAPTSFLFDVNAITRIHDSLTFLGAT